MSRNTRVQTLRNIRLAEEKAKLKISEDIATNEGEKQEVEEVQIVIINGEEYSADELAEAAQLIRDNN